MKFSKKLLCILLAAVTVMLPASLIGCSSKEESVIVQTNAYFAPFEYFDGDKIVGVDVDIMNKVGEKMGKKVEFVNTEFGLIIDNVSAGSLCDCGAAGITVTDARKEKVDFSIPYYTSVQYVIFEKDALEVDGSAEDGTEYILWSSLAGLKIGVQQDTTGDIYTDGEINATEADENYGYNGVLYGSGASMARFDNAQLAVDAIGAKTVDVVIVDQLPAEYIVSKNTQYVAYPVYYEAEEGEENYPTSEEYAICVTKGKDDLLKAINEVLTEMLVKDEATGKSEIETLVSKHFGIN